MSRLLTLSLLPLVLIFCSCTGSSSEGVIAPAGKMTQTDIDQLKADPGMATQANTGSQTPPQQQTKSGGGALID